MKPTYDDLLELIALLREENRQLREEVRRLQKKVESLEERLKLNSKNSSLPPSKDQKANKQQPKGGAKPGHQGKSRPLFPEHQISKTVTSSLDCCPHCGSHHLRYEGPVVSQQVDLPPIQPQVTQIEQQRACCLNCHRHAIAPFPPGYAQTAFGPRLTAFVGMCSAGYRLSKRSIQDLLKTGFGIDCSLGSLSSMEKRLSRGLEAPYQDLFQQVDQAKIGYIDETSFREGCKTHYVWTIATPRATFLKVLPTRGIASLDQIRPRGHPSITISDRYQAYVYPKHQYCLAHIRRDLEKFAARAGVDGEIGRRALFELLEVFVACDLEDRKTMQQRVGYRRRRLLDILHDALAEGSKELSRFSYRLLASFKKLFLFTRYEGVGCTNNAAERALRHIVLWRKTSYGTQSEAGSRFMERSVSLWQTLRKRDQPVFTFFLQAYQSTFDASVAKPVI